MECLFQPELVSRYTPEYISDLNFVERSYKWNERKHQKIKRRRQSQIDRDETVYLKNTEPSPMRSNYAGGSNLSPSLKQFSNITLSDYEEIRKRSMRRSIEHVLEE